MNYRTLKCLGNLRRRRDIADSAMAELDAAVHALDYALQDDGSWSSNTIAIVEYGPGERVTCQVGTGVRNVEITETNAVILRIQDIERAVSVYRSETYVSAAAEVELGVSATRVTTDDGYVWTINRTGRS